MPKFSLSSAADDNSFCNCNCRFKRINFSRRDLSDVGVVDAVVLDAGVVDVVFVDTVAVDAVVVDAKSDSFDDALTGAAVVLFSNWRFLYIKKMS